jgi:hypothetical protein
MEDSSGFFSFPGVSLSDVQRGLVQEATPQTSTPNMASKSGLSKDLRGRNLFVNVNLIFSHRVESLGGKTRASLFLTIILHIFYRFFVYYRSMLSSLNSQEFSITGKRFSNLPRLFLYPMIIDVEL